MPELEDIQNGEYLEEGTEDDVLSDSVFESITDTVERFAISGHLPIVMNNPPMNNSISLMYSNIKHIRLPISYDTESGVRLIRFTRHRLPSLKHLSITDITVSNKHSLARKIGEYINEIANIQMLESLALKTTPSNIQNDTNVTNENMFLSLRRLPNLTELILDLVYIENNARALLSCRRLNSLSIVISTSSYPNGFSFEHILKIQTLRNLVIDFEDSEVSFGDERTLTRDSTVSNLTISCNRLGDGFLYVRRLSQLKYLTVILPEMTDEDNGILNYVVSDNFQNRLVVNIRSV
jgi:hypothetical protein